jgi:hypothetical protein
MNEIDYVRGQLAAERAHLREILRVLHAGTAPIGHPRPAQLYVDWAGRRLVQQLTALQTALQAASESGPDTRAQLTGLRSAMARLTDTTSVPSPHLHAEPLLAVLEAWSDPLDVLAGTTLRVAHWRQAAHLSADTILEERRLYAAARGAMGLS